MNNIAYVFIPLAYNGPCVVESGPKVMQFELNKKYGNKDMYMYELRWDETPKDYINRVYKNMICLIQRYNKLIVFGGNHLSILPVYWIAEKMFFNSITFDAHRDYLKNNGLITHASFLRYVNGHNNKRYIMGFRDKIKKSDEYNFFDAEISAELLKTQKLNFNIKDLINFIDIDVDFFDECVFPYTYCKKANGFTLSDFTYIIKQINLANLRIISFSEYIQLNDSNKFGIDFIFEILKELLT